MLGRDLTNHDDRDHCVNPSGRHILGPSSRILPTLPEGLEDSNYAKDSTTQQNPVA